MFNYPPLKCPVCLQDSADKKFILDFESNEGRFSLFECPVCKVQFWYPFKHFRIEWYNKKYDKNVYNIVKPASASRNVFKIFLSRHKSSYQNKMNVLDFGCGQGVFLRKLINSKFDACGIDINKYALDYAKKTGLENIFLLKEKQSITSILQNTTFNFITIFEVFEHLDNHLQLLNQLKLVLKNDGLLVLSVPYRKRILVGIDLFDYPPNHLTRWDKNAIRNILWLAGFSIKYIRRADDIDLTTDSLYRYLKKYLFLLTDSSTISADSKVKNYANKKYIKSAYIFFVIMISKLKNLLRIGNTLYVEAELKK